MLGLNAAFQRRVAFEKPLVIGAVNRASESGGGVGGKGQGAYLAAAAARPGSVTTRTEPNRRRKASVGALAVVLARESASSRRAAGLLGQ